MGKYRMRPEETRGRIGTDEARVRGCVCVCVMALSVDHVNKAMTLIVPRAVLYVIQDVTSGGALAVYKQILN